MCGVPARYVVRTRMHVRGLRYLRGVMRRSLILLLVVILAACSGSSKSSTTSGGGGSTTAQPTEKVLVNVDAAGVALGGFDPMGYRQFNKPVTGLPEHTTKFGGATYQFSSADHITQFSGAEHAPAYGGYCAYAASMGRLSPADPLAFEVYEGKLLVFTNEEFRDLFKQDPAGTSAKADAAWPALVAEHGK